MTLEELMQKKDIPDKIDLPGKDLIKLLKKHKGLLKERERDTAFWAATNENLKIAYEKLDEKERELERAYGIIQEDLSVASQIQSAFLPKPVEKMNQEIDMAVYHKQLTEVGGDYYDFFQTKSNSYAIGVFDISGHGVSAALVMTYLKAQFMQIMESLVSPKKIVEWVNSTSYNFLREVKKYATVNFLVFNKKSFHYICGGGFGMLIHKKDPCLFIKKDHFLGLRNKPFNEYELPFEKDDLLILYTDGMVEAQNKNQQDYSMARLNNLIIENQSKNVNELLKLCLQDYENFRDKDSDDITLIIARKKV